MLETNTLFIISVVLAHHITTRVDFLHGLTSFLKVPIYLNDQSLRETDFSKNMW